MYLGETLRYYQLAPIAIGACRTLSDIEDSPLNPTWVPWESSQDRDPDLHVTVKSFQTYM